ncbi:MAG: homocysteine S-methyltransferase family protein [Ignavibacteriaceae bacterium]|nr:homocysteine S-methyltransferase family protein [Ignavibacteriaceae bacterium]
MSSKFVQAFEERKLILTEGSIIERLRRGFNYALDDNLLNAAMLYDDAGRKILEEIYSGYIKLGLDENLPVIILTPTWRANSLRISNSQFADKNINRDAFEFLNNIRNKFFSNEDIFIGGLMGVKGDSYKPEVALNRDEAYLFHSWQAKQLAEAGVDFLIASTVPSLKEGTGIAKAMAAQNIPYIISFVIHPVGSLLDGTMLDEAIKYIDSKIEPTPLAFMVNCVHPSIFIKALEQFEADNIIYKRLYGLQANASDKSPEELDNADVLHSDDPLNWGILMADLSNRYKMKVLGGCCGTGSKHIKCLTENLIESKE